jgi:hypothetical protein
VDKTTRQRADGCLGEAGYDLVEAIRLYKDRFGPIGYTEISTVTQMWTEMGQQALEHLAYQGASGHGLSAESAESMTVSDRFEVHRAIHRGNEPAGHGHEMDPFSAGLGEVRGQPHKDVP